jgi:hypothetical protein
MVLADLGDLDHIKCAYCGRKMMRTDTSYACTNYACYTKNWGRDFDWIDVAPTPIDSLFTWIKKLVSKFL